MEIKSDPASHFMHLGVRDYENGKIDAKPVTCVGWFYFKEMVDKETIWETVMEQQIKRVFRYHAVPAEKDGWTQWQDIGIENLDKEYHFQVVEGFDTQEEWDNYLAEETKKGLDFGKPWWRYILVRKTPGGRCALVSVIDHTMADGASAVSSLLSMCEKVGDNPVFGGKKKKNSQARQLTRYEQLYAFSQGILQPLSEINPFASETVTKLKQPKGVFPTKWRFGSSKPDESVNVLKLKAIKERVPGATVNDVLLTVTALAIREYYKEENDPIMKTNKDIRGTLAVNTRPHGADYLSDEYFGNHIVVATQRYPLHQSRLETLSTFRTESRLRKFSPDTAMRQLIMKTLNYLPRDKIVEIAAEASCKFSIMISNVVFSLEPLKIFGQTIDDVQFIAQTPLGCYIGSGTYCDKISFNAVVTQDTGADPHRIVSLMRSECDKLYDEVMTADRKTIDSMDKPLVMPLWVQILLAVVWAWYLGLLY